MVSRPFIRKHIEELEREFEERRGDAAFLKELLAELQHRSVPRALRLLSKVRDAMDASPLDAATTPEPAPETIHLPSEAEPMSEPAESSDPATQSSPPISSDADDMVPDDAPVPVPPDVASKPRPPVTDRPENILSAWTALEVLAPHTFKKPSDMVDGNERSVARFDTRPLPWEGSGENPRPKTRLFYHLVLGSVRMGVATKRLLQAFGDTRPERPSGPKDFSALAFVTLDAKGRLADSDAVTISSFAWGLPIACRRELANLDVWTSKEGDLKTRLVKSISREDDQGAALPLTKEDIDRGYRTLLAALGLDAAVVEPPSFALRVYQWVAIEEPPDTPLLNSFFLDDLAQAGALVKDGKEGEALARYLGRKKPSQRYDLLNEQKLLKACLAPARIPAARWPGKGRHPLVLLQQAAVNLARSELSKGGLLGVNGPPGTGKTTLLRDLVAGVVMDRSIAMAAYDDPETAFTHAGQFKIGKDFCHLYRVSETIKGHEILVASSNNKAVENISKELPGIDQIADDLGLKYFNTLSNETAGEEGATWGMIAAVLGNASNRYAFRQAVWDNDDTSLKHYLKAARGEPVVVKFRDHATGRDIERPPLVVSQENPPKDKEDALVRWRRARADFNAALKKAETALAGLEEVRKLLEILPALRTSVEQSRLVAETTARQATEAEQNAGSAREFRRQRKEDLDDSKRDVDARYSVRPGFFARLFRTKKWRIWNEMFKGLESIWRKCVAASSDADTRLGHAQRFFEEAKRKATEASQAAANASAKLQKAEDHLAKARSIMGTHFADDSFWSQGHEDLQKSTPWLTSETQRLRDDVFAAAIRLHRAFLDAAAKPMRHNLMALFSAWRGTGLGKPENESVIPDLWSSLFLVTPVISTTFASVGRMLGRLPKESLGWLLIDEAGQAVPQAAIGAVMRAKRAMVVGDPLQIEPVVPLAPSLVDAICADCGVDADLWGAPKASAQTVADMASPFGHEMNRDTGSIWIGAPLLVHRRCVEPMFSISNNIAYDRKMVLATPDKPSQLQDVLGPSHWHDIQGRGETKWCQEEGLIVTRMLNDLHRAGLDSPDIYVISPFKVVASEMRKLMQRHADEALAAWSGEKQWDWLSSRIGTVHTFQGKEAEAVIFLLGAPNPEQRGARLWAGSTPNILNVASTRAKSALYVVGNRSLWQGMGCFRELDQKLLT